MKRASFFLIALGAAVVAISPAQASTTFLAGSGDYGTPSNWSNGVPDSANTGLIGSGSVAQVSTAIVPLTGLLTIGQLDQPGTLTVIGPGSITAGQVELGKNLGAGSSGTLNVLGGAVTMNTLLIIGFDQDNPRLALGIPGDYFFTLIDHNGYSGVTSMTPSFLNFAPSYIPLVSYNAGDIQLKITVVPEPGGWMLLGMTALHLGAPTRRRERPGWAPSSGSSAVARLTSPPL